MTCRSATCPLCGAHYGLAQVPDTNTEPLPPQPCGACWYKLPPEERAPYIFTLRASPTLLQPLGHRDPTRYAMSPTLVAYVAHLEAMHNSTRLCGRPSPAALVAALSANLTYAARGGGFRAARTEDQARISWPKVGDFVRVMFALGPSETTHGWLVSVSTPKAEFHTRYVIEDLNGVVREWYNVQVEGVPLGDHYANTQDKRWAHPNDKELPLMDGSKIGVRITSHDADGKITQEAAILPPTFTDNTQEKT